MKEYINNLLHPANGTNKQMIWLTANWNSLSGSGYVSLTQSHTDLIKCKHVLLRLFLRFNFGKQETTQPN